MIYLPVKDYAKLAKVSRQYIHELINKDKIPHIKIFLKPTLFIKLTEEEYNELQNKELDNQ